MRAAVLGALQERMVDGIKRANPGCTDAEIANAAGVDRSQVSKWRAGAREMRLTELVGLLRCYGAAEALGEIAALGGADVVDRGSVAREPRQAAIEATARMAMLSTELHQALADGVLTRDERERIKRSAEALILDIRAISRAEVAQ